MWLKDAVAQLAQSPVCDYHVGAPGASEPTALAGLLLHDHVRVEEAHAAAAFLLSLQQESGCVGMRTNDPWPHWPTSLALLLWRRLRDEKYELPISRAIAWTLSLEGQRIEHDENAGHNTRLAAWPWVEGTHSWLEPSALFTLALKAHGLATHRRTREAVTLLIDRLLPEGGCNYGNTFVLGQKLRPHVQPTGIVLLALVGEDDSSGRIARSVNYLEQACAGPITPHSLAWALLGLAAHGREVNRAAALLQTAAEQVIARGASHYSLALLATAGLGREASLVRFARGEEM